mgnify:CR=1 FL=1
MRNEEEEKSYPQITQIGQIILGGLSRPYQRRKNEELSADYSDYTDYFLGKT